MQCTLKMLLFFHVFSCIEYFLRLNMMRALCNVGAQKGTTIETAF